MTRNALSALPPELLNEICSYLCGHCVRRRSIADLDIRAACPVDRGPGEGHPEPRACGGHERADLHNLSLVCKTLRASAEPFLYHRVCISQPGTLQLFVRTLDERADLQLRVLELRIHHVGRSTGWPGVFPESTYRSVFLPALLRRVPNLERLSVYLPSTREPSWSLVQPNFYSPRLAFLESLAISGFEDGFFCLDRAAPIMRLYPNFRTLHCGRCNWVTEGFGASMGRVTLADPPPLRNLTTLILTHTRINAWSLRNLLDAIGPGLSKVRIYRDGELLLSVNDNDDVVELDDAVAALQPWRATLNELSFSIDGIVLPPSPSHFHGMHLLRNFKVLKVLRVHAASFDFFGDVGDQAAALDSTIPDSVSELRLFGLSNLAPALRGLLEAHRAGGFECLSKIEIDDQKLEQYEPEWEAARDLRDVRDGFRSVGVNFIVHSESAQSAVDG